MLFELSIDEMESEESKKLGRKMEEESEFSKQVLTLLAKGQRGEATELMSSKIQNLEFIKTVRDDSKTESYIYRDGQYINNAATYIKQYVRKFVGEAYTEQLASAVLSKIFVDTYIDIDLFFKVYNPFRRLVLNGILDLREKKLFHFDPNEIHFVKLPVIFDPGKDCPNIKKHFETV